MKYWIKNLTSGVVLAILLLSLVGGNVYSDEALDNKILRKVAQEQGIALHRLEIGMLQPKAFSLTGVTLYQAKVIDIETGEVYGVVVDQEGETQSLEDARLAEREAYEARYGRLDPVLYDLLQTMADDDRLTIAIWLKADDLTPLDRPTPDKVDGVELLPPEPGPWSIINLGEEKTDSPDQEALAAHAAAIRALQADQRAAAEAARQANLVHLADQVAVLQAPLLADLEAQGVAPTYVSPIAPLIYVEVSKSDILTLAQRSDVDTVYGPNENFEEMDVAKPTQKANIVDGWGFEGTGIDVAIIEADRIEFNNPYLNAGTTRDTGGAIGDHVTAVAGMVASQHGTYQGIAQGVALFSANATSWDDADLSAAMDWSVLQGVDIISNSWGGNASNTNLNIHDRHLDYIVRYNWKTVTKSAGNENDGCGNGTGRVTSPGRGWNVITVGNYADQNTLSWDDDAMDACSSYVDPSTGVEKPEVAASGSSINSTTTASPWVGGVGSGTSYSAPQVAGEAALLMERQSSLINWPEAVKAVIMATALHNIEGSSRLSEYDGAGGVDMRAAFRVVDEGWWDARNVTSSSFPYSLYVYAYAGETVRAAIAWDSNPSSDYSSDTLEADIDLHVYDPSGVYVTSSTSSPNSFEVVEFVASTTGNYELRVIAYSFSGSSEYIGAAWWPGHRVLTAYTPQSLGTPPTSHDYFRFAPTSYWNVVGIRPPSGTDYDIRLYSDSAFGDPDDYNLLASSAYGGSYVDFVLVDLNHAPSGSYYPEVYAYSGTGTYAVEWASHTADVVEGTYGPYSMSTSQVLRVWDSSLSAGVRKYFAVKPTSGDADLAMALYGSDSSTSSTWYQYRGQSVAYANATGAGGDEYMNYQASTSDWMGLVVWNNASTSATNFYLYADTSAPSGSIVINSGATYAASTAANLTLSASDGQTGVDEMRFSNDGSTWSSWEPYATSKSWTLTSGDGTKTVYVQFQNNVGMISSSYSDSIILDTVAPTGSIVIDGGAAYATSTAVNLTLSASDGGSGMSEMRIGNLGGTWGPWEPYATSKSWTLIAGDGTKAVYVQYRDNAGNVSQYNDTIVLDTTGPTGSVVVDGGATYATSTAVNLTLSASDTTSGVDEMCFSNDGSTWSSWEPYATSKSWTLTSGDGTKTVYAQYQDNAGNVSSQYNDTIVLDTTAPSGSIVIDGGATYATSTAVNLTLSASDATSGVDEMCFSNDGSTWSSWEPYATSKSWTLTSGDGTKTVYAQYRDNAGNVSSQYNDTIVLDTTIPTGSIVIDSGATYATSTAVNLTLSASDAGSGVDEMCFSNDGSTWSSWEPYATSASWTLTSGDGTKTVYAQYRDNAGNVSSQYNDTIFLDTTTPTGSIVIDGGATYAASTAVSLTLSASDAGSGVNEMRFSNDESTWSSWEPYATSASWTLTSGDGTKTVYVQYQDNAGNVSTAYSDTIVLDTMGPTGSIVIDSGAMYAASTAVNLTLSASDAGSGIDEMCFSDDGSTWSSWEPYATSKSWTLTSGDGTKAVYAQYRDNVGYISTAYSDTIILDTTTPTGTIVIDGGATYAISTVVSLTLSASDATSGIDEMRFSNDESTWSSWEAYATSASWTLTSGDGTKAVYVQYRDNAGNVSTAYSDTIVLDTMGPTGSIVIDSGVTYAASTAVSLTLSASDAGSGVDEVCFSNDGSTWSGWEPYATSKSWTLTSGDGTKTVYAQYRDNAGNVSTAYSDTIVLDTMGPTGSIVIDSGATYAASTAVSLTLSASDAGSGVDEMCFSDDGSTWSSWEPYATSASWTLTSGDGTKMVYAQYRDNVGYISTAYSDTIILDTTTPTGSVVIDSGAMYVASTAVSLTLSAGDTGSGVAEMCFSNDESTWSSWEPYATSASWTLTLGDGTKTVYAQYRDNVGYVSTSYSDTIVLDTTAPDSDATSPENSAFTSFTVSWSGADTHSGIASCDIQYRVGISGTWTTWISATSDTSAVFGPSVPVTVERGETYYFQVRARDNAGNLEAYPGGDGNTSTYINDLFLVYLPMVQKMNTLGAESVYRR